MGQPPEEEKRLSEILARLGQQVAADAFVAATKGKE